MKEIIKRATNAKEVFFHFFRPPMQTIEMLPECLEHLPYMRLRDAEPYSGKFERLKSLVITDYGFVFCII